jgi:subtilisin family serine protease
LIKITQTCKQISKGGLISFPVTDEGVIGVAPEADLYGVKVLDRTGRGYESDVIAGIQWSIDNKMQVISMSLGGGDSSGMEGACNNAYNAGIVVVASAGNSGPDDDTVGYPAKYDSVIAVSATDDTNTPEVELAAPGVSILSTYLGGGYATASGTSMACPHVAGTAALVIASGITDENGNEMINDEIRTRLQETAEDLGDLVT